MKNVLIIIAGPPCTGKTTLGRKIASEFRLPFMSKDELKEVLFDSIGIKDRDWSKQLGIASLKLLDSFIESILRTGRPVVIENNFKDEYDSIRLQDLIEKYDYSCLQIQCMTEGNILFRRFIDRSESNDRHPGHADHLNSEEFKDELLSGIYQPLQIKGELIWVDTTDLKTIDYEPVLQKVRTMLQS